MRPPLDIGRVVSRVVAIYRAQAGILLPAAFLVYLPVAILSAAAYADDASPLLLLLGAIVAAIGSFWLQGVVVGAVDDIQDARRDETVGSLFAKVRPILGRLILAGILAGLGIGLGLLLLIVPGLVLLTWWSLIIPVLVLERVGVPECFGRSRALVRGNGWRVFAVVVLLGLAQAILSGILRSLFSGLAGSFAGDAIGDLVANTLLGPVSALAVAVVYFELVRRRPEAPAPLGRPEAPFSPPIAGPPERPVRPADPPEE